MTTRWCPLTRIDGLGDLLLALTQKEQLESVRNVNLCTNSLHMLMLVDDVVVRVESLHRVVGDGRLGVSELDGEAVGDGDEVGGGAGRVDVDTVGEFPCNLSLGNGRESRCWRVVGF
jgi:hypothetical protein